MDFLTVLTSAPEAFNTEHMVILTNVGVAIVSLLLTGVTAVAAWAALRDSRKSDDLQQERLVKIIDTTLKREQEYAHGGDNADADKAAAE